MLLRIILYVLGKKFYNIIELGHIILTRGIFAFLKKSAALYMYRIEKTFVYGYYRYILEVISSEIQ